MNKSSHGQSQDELAAGLVSPLIPFIENILDSLQNVAPEKQADLIRLLSQHRPKVKLNYSRGFFFAADPGTKRIEMSLQGLEFLWAAAYMFYVVYNACARSSKKGEGYLTFDQDKGCQVALLLYKWASDNLNAPAATPWPKTLPCPSKGMAVESNEYVVTELFLCAAAWILHHELAHIRLGHVDGLAISIPQEKVADEEATRWILQDCPKGAPCEKRALGIAIAILVLTSLDYTRGTFESASHPRSYQRLFDAMVDTINDEDHRVYGFIIVIMKAYMDRYGIESKEDPTRSYFACFQDYCKILARVGSG